MPAYKKGTDGWKKARKKWRETMKKRYGSVSTAMAVIGAKGGRNGHTGGFAANPELAREAGRKGGKKSRAYKRFCPKGHRVHRELESKKYKWYCPECDENYFSFEVKNG